MCENVECPRPFSVEAYAAQKPFPALCTVTENKAIEGYKEASKDYDWCENHFRWIVWNKPGIETDDESTRSNFEGLLKHLDKKGTCKRFSVIDPHNYILISGELGVGWKAEGPDDIVAEGKSVTKAFELVIARVGHDLPLHYENGEL